MFSGKHWEFTYTIEKVNGSRERTKDVEFRFDLQPGEESQYLRRRCQELVDRYDFRAIEGHAAQIDRVDRGTGLVYYTTPPEIRTMRVENVQ